MPLDIKKIDERIKKLQELRRIASDPEMAALLSEFLTLDDGLAVNAASSAKLAPAEPPMPAPKPDDVSQFVKGVLDGSESVRTSSPLPGWSGRKP